MLKFTLTLPVIFSLYISFSQAQYTLPSCAVSCVQSASSQAGCDPNDPACVCSNPTFIDAVSTCVQQSCSDADIQAAAAYWATLCTGASSGTGSTATDTGSASTSLSSSITGPVSVTGTGTSSSVSGSSTGTSTTSSSVTSTGPSSSRTSGSSSSGSSSSSRSTTSSSTSNLAAALPTHAAALVAGGIGALIAVVV